MNQMKFRNTITKSFSSAFINPLQNKIKFRNTITKQHNLLANQPTQCNKELLEKFIVPQLAKKFPEFHETQKFITMLTTAHD